jgi:hypothetical protein
MKESFGERMGERIYGARWEAGYYKREIRNADLYIDEAKRKIAEIKKKYPRKWKGMISGWLFDISYNKDNKKFAIRNLARIQALRRAHKLGKVI